MMVSLLGNKSGRTLESATNSTLKLGVDTDPIPCYIINIIRKRGQDENIFKHIRNSFNIPRHSSCGR